MKTYIWCKLFGHKFLSESKRLVRRNDIYNTWSVQSEPTTFCLKCGLSKAEISSGTWGGNGILSKTKNDE